MTNILIQFDYKKFKYAYNFIKLLPYLNILLVILSYI